MPSERKKKLHDEKIMEFNQFVVAIVIFSLSVQFVGLTDYQSKSKVTVNSIKK